MAASSPLPLSLTTLGTPAGGRFPTPGQLCIKGTLLMAAAYKSGDEASSPTPQSDPSPLGRTNSAGSDNPQQPKSPPVPTAVERNTSGDTNEEESNLRRTCDGCTISKIKCDGGQPCKRCQRRRSQCVYREKKRCGPKRRRSTREESEDDSDAPATGGSEDSRFMSTHKILTSRERQFIAKFYNSVNRFIPMTCHTVLRDAMNPLPLNVIDGFVPSEEDRNVHHARKALLLGGVALGAVFCGDAGAAGAYMARAQIHLKDCFDALLPEVVSCYLVMVIYHLHFLDRSKVFRYIGFAQQAFRELKPAQQPAASNVRDSVRMLSAFLHVACDSDIRVEETEILADTRPDPGTKTQSRILSLFSYVLLMLHRRCNPAEAAEALSQGKVQPSLARLAAMADEGELLLTMTENPGSFGIIVMKTLRGYFLLQKGKLQEVYESVALPVAKALEADHGVINFPLCWHMCQCVTTFLRRWGNHTASAGMDRIMEPLRQTLAFSNCCCNVSLELLNTYAGKNTAKPHMGLFSDACQDKGISPVSGGGTAVANETSTESEEHKLSDPDGRSSPSSLDLSSSSSLVVPLGTAKEPTVGMMVAPTDPVGPVSGAHMAPVSATELTTRQASTSPHSSERDTRHQSVDSDSNQGSDQAVRDSPSGPWGVIALQGGVRGNARGGSSRAGGGTHGPDNEFINGEARGIPGGLHSVLHSSSFAGSRFEGRATALAAPASRLLAPAPGIIAPGPGVMAPAPGVVAPAPGGISPAAGGGVPAPGVMTLAPTIAMPTAAPPLCSLGPHDVSQLHRYHMAFDLGTQPPILEAESKSNPFGPNSFALPMWMLPSSAADDSERDETVGTGAGDGDGAMVLHQSSNTATPRVSVRPSSEPSPPDPGGVPDDGSDPNESALISGVLDMSCG